MAQYRIDGRVHNAWQVPDYGEPPSPELLALVQKHNWNADDNGIELADGHSAPANSWLIQINDTLFVSLPDDEFQKGFVLVE